MKLFEKISHFSKKSLQWWCEISGEPQIIKIILDFPLLFKIGKILTIIYYMSYFKLPSRRQLIEIYAEISLYTLRDFYKIPHAF
ncbi:hypothetical protein AB834_07145 [PVC group bacterium (ex Bugula neritina AB1)]|nr:hypothetical protein AB834_07145 [PVC group bacterium (ex Bugula neritina AB1)]